MSSPWATIDRSSTAAVTELLRARVMMEKDDAAASKKQGAAAAPRDPNGVAARLAAPITEGVRPVSAASLEVKSEQSEIHHYAQAVRNECVVL